MLIHRSPDGSLTLPASLINALDACDSYDVRVNSSEISLVPSKNLRDEVSAKKKRNINNIIGSAKGLFGSVEEIDAMIRDIRSE